MRVPIINDRFNSIELEEDLDNQVTRVKKQVRLDNVRGQYSGFDFDGGSVGIFRQPHSNICRIVQLGDTESSKELRDKLVEVLKDAGFSYI